MRIIIFDPFPPNKNPNPHLLKYVNAAAHRVFGRGNVSLASLSDSIGLPSDMTAGIVFGSLAYVKREIKRFNQRCKGAHLPLCLWSTDDPYEIDTNLEYRECFEWIWTSDKASVPFYDSENVEHLPLAADPAVHSFPFQDESASYDVSFVGVEFPNRKKLIEELGDLLNGVRAIVVGPNWSVAAKFIRYSRVSNQEAAQISNQSKVVLNLGRSYDLANTRGITPSTPGPRTFEVGGCSTVQLVTWEQPEIEDYYSPGTEVVFCDGLEELKQQIRWLLRNPTSRKMIAEAAFKKTLAYHLYDHRLEKIRKRIDEFVS